MNCQLWNLFFDHAWPAIAVAFIAWAVMDTLKEKWELAAVLRVAAGLFWVGGLIMLGAVTFLGASIQSPCRAEDAGKIERIHQFPRP